MSGGVPPSSRAQDLSAAEWARWMADIRDRKPRPLAKLYGSRGPTPEQAARYADAMREWSAQYRYASKMQKAALKRDNERMRNPQSRQSAIARGADLYERFSGHDPEIIGSIRIPDVPEVGVVIGTLDFLGYTTIRDGVTEKYIHEFAARDKPELVVSVNGKTIHVVGGRYTFTERGIVDDSDKSR